MSTRQNRLRALIDSRSAGNQAAFAGLIGRKPAVVWQYLSGHRVMGEKFARHVERKLHLPPGWMDQPHMDDAYQPASAIHAPAQEDRPADIGDQADDEALDILAARLDRAPHAVKADIARLYARYFAMPESRPALLRAIRALEQRTQSERPPPKLNETCTTIAQAGVERSENRLNQHQNADHRRSGAIREDH